jgi:hypothetical protein
MNLLERNKKLIEEYPFLQPRNVWTDKISEDYDYSYVLGVDDIPKGWKRLFLQMCMDLKKQLVKDNYLDKFRFTQIKEKYNTMRLYNNGCSEKAQHILDKYEYMSRYVCTICGNVAEYETQGYRASFCRDCWKDWVRHERCENITFKPYYRVIEYSNGEKFYKKISFKKEWNKYLKGLKNV